MLFSLPNVFSFKETINSRYALWSPTVHVLKEGKIFMLFNHKYIYIYMAYKYIYMCIHINFILIFYVGLQKRRRLFLQSHGNLKRPHLSAELVAWCTRNTKALCAGFISSSGGIPLVLGNI